MGKHPVWSLFFFMGFVMSEVLFPKSTLEEKMVALTTKVLFLEDQVVELNKFRLELERPKIEPVEDFS
tara:strand:- start:379 stop:582 length:204 start_codon:yes stop_codon:yes gene_type:complete